MTELSFTVWQFVRVMVRLEAVAEASPKSVQADLYEDWREDWERLDARLAGLAQSDEDAYSELMMDSDFAIACDRKPKLRAVLATLDEVVAELAAETRTCADKDLREHLRFEATELKALRRDISKKLPRRADEGG